MSRAQVVVLVGNPRPGSRTRTAAEILAARASARLAPAADHVTIDLADLAGEIFAASHPRVDDALRTVTSAHLLVVGTPVYKGSYTGLLKAFLDLLGPDGLHDVPTIPLVVSASPAHQHAGESHLLPLLVELGARVPDRALALLESELQDTAAHADLWLDDTTGDLVPV